MTITRLQISNVRNLVAVKLANFQQVNIFYGHNGSGKTSVLEAIHILGMARSFRGSSIKSLISHDEESCTVFGETLGAAQGLSQSLGVQRLRTGTSLIKVAGVPVRSVAQLVEHLPLQLINSTSFDLLAGPPTTRRQFLNWGVFHVEHRFFGEWQRYQRCIKQRNVLLRHGKIRGNELSVWTRDLASSGVAINHFRMSYMERLVPKFELVMEKLAPELSSGLQLRFRRGWDKSMELSSALESSLAADKERGYTMVGPHRADLKVHTEGYSAAETLSRGQQKLVVIGLKLAQGMVMAELNGSVCTYLVDDLPSELDSEHCQRVCEVLASIG
ncbi:MAG: DNA replication/repair protein RecF, partial [Porticoccus sp.]